jgi:thiamine-phosphate pyrophosphorylase
MRTLPVERTGDWRRRRLAEARLYVVTGARERFGDLEGFLDAILGAGVDIVQLREKEWEAGDLIRWGEVFLDTAIRHEALFVMNDRPDVALAVGADGVHVGQNDLPVGFVRQLVGPDVLIGLSTHDRDQLRSASPEASYVCVGPVHPTPTKPGRRATGVRLVREAAEMERRPWFAIGGIDPETLPSVVRAGASRIVVVRAVTESDDPAGAVQRLLGVLAASAGDGRQRPA